MDNNDVFRRLRYLLAYNDTKMAEVFALAGETVQQGPIVGWLKKEDDKSMVKMPDVMLASFLNGLINQKRGKKDGPQPEPEQQINNNIIFRKLRIAYDLKTEDVIALFKLVGKEISPHELSAFFRKPTSNKYRECNDQYLRYFLNGLEARFRTSKN